MKIVHLVSQDFGGAGRAAVRINEALRSIGADSSILTLDRRNEKEYIHQLYTGSKGTEISKRYFSDLQLISNKFPNRKKGAELFSVPFALNDLKNNSLLKEADIINLHWVSGLIDFRQFREVFGEKKIVWTLHDMNPFTGGCHYSDLCTRYKTACGNCPELGTGAEYDISSEYFNIKKEVYKGIDINVVTPSKWLGRVSGESKIFGGYPHHVIPNCVPQDIYTPNDKAALKQALNIPADSKVVLFGADYILNYRKGLAYLLKALEGIEERDKVIFASFGDSSGMNLQGNIKYLDFGKVSREEDLAKIYSLADVFVIPSLEDNLPNTVVEALSCGTPVVGFNTGGIPDMVDHLKNGYVAEYKNTDDLAEGIKKIVFSSDHEGMRINARQKAVGNYSFEKTARAYLDLYNDITGREKTKLPYKEINISVPAEAPAITLVTASYNSERYLEECMDSVLSQNYPNLQYIIMDGGSTDGTTGIIRKYEKYLYHWQSGKDGGQYAAISEGLNKGTGEIMSWINSDDMLYPFSLYTMADAFSSIPAADWITGVPSLMNELSANMIKLVPKNWTREGYLNLDYKYIQQEGTFWRRSLWEKAGGYLSTEYELAGDLELWTRFFRYAELYYIDQLTGVFRKHSSQKTGGKGIEAYDKEAEIILARERRQYPFAQPKETNNNRKIKVAGPQKLKVTPGDNMSAGSEKEKELLLKIYHDPADKKVLTELAELKAGEGKITAAKGILANTWFRYPEYTTAALKLAQLELKDFTYADAFSVVQKIFNEMKDNYEFLLAASDIKNKYGCIFELTKCKMWYEQKDYIKSTECFNKAMKYTGYNYRHSLVTDGDVVTRFIDKFTGWFAGLRYDLIMKELEKEFAKEKELVI